MTYDKCTIGIAQPAPPTVLIQNPLTSRHLLSIHPDGTVTGEIEDASEAARVFVEHIRMMIGQPTQSDAHRKAPIWTEATTIQTNGRWDGNIAQTDKPLSRWQKGFNSGVEEAAKALEADAKLCDCAAREERECGCGAWWDYKTIKSERAVEIVRALKDSK